MGIIAEVNRDKKERVQPYTYKDFFEESEESEEVESPAEKTNALLLKMRRIQASHPDLFKGAKKPD